MANQASNSKTKHQPIDQRGDDQSYMLLVVSFLCATLAGVTVLS